MLPDDDLFGFEERFQKLESRLEEEAVKLDQILKENFVSLQESHSALQKSLDDLDARVERMNRILAWRRNDRLHFSITNLVLDTAKFAAQKLGRDDLMEPDAIYELAQFAGQLSTRVLICLKIPTKYEPCLQSLKQVIESYDVQAHETKTEFARFLLEPEEKKEYDKWQELFPAIYDKTVEDLAKEKDFTWD